jgi:hypothetical protein
LSVAENKPMSPNAVIITSFVHGRVDHGNRMLIEKNCRERKKPLHRS